MRSSPSGRVTSEYTGSAKSSAPITVPAVLAATSWMEATRFGMKSCATSIAKLSAAPSATAIAAGGRRRSREAKCRRARMPSGM